MDVTDVICGPISTTLLIGLSSLILFVWYSYKKQSYWKNKGIPSVKPFPILGSLMENLKSPSHELEMKRYNELGPVYGHYEGNRPLLSVGDTKLVRDILIKDFQFFPGRKLTLSDDGIMGKTLLGLEGEDWKRVRSIITPTFSSRKLKLIISIFKDCSRTLVQNFKIAAQNAEDINIKQFYRAFAMDVTASSIFSTKIDSHNNPKNLFVQMVGKVFSKWRFFLICFFPSFMKFFGILMTSRPVIDFFKNTAVQIIEERKRTGIKRNDFLQLLLETSEEVTESMNCEDAKKDEDLDCNYNPEITSEKVFKNISKKHLSTVEMVSQCVTFLIIGNSGLSHTLTFATYSLATNESVQEKSREEIIECLKGTNGELTYDALQNMKYIDNVISETLRLYPTANRLERKAASNYELGDTGITIPKGMGITIPVYALQNDPKYYPEPTKFDPNRFTAEERGKRDPYTFMPFGGGPRSCIAMRFALLEMKVCLVHIISCFNIKTCSRTQIPPQFEPGITVQLAKDIFLKMELREDCPLYN